MIANFTGFIDANVFFGARLRSLLLELAMTGLFRACWSEDVHREWMEAVANRRGIDVSALERTRRAMDRAVPDCLVTGYADQIARYTLPDPGDRHVLAAAVAGGADVIVTFNEMDFPTEELAKYGIQRVHPDDFILDIHSLSVSLFVEAVAGDLAHYKQPPIAFDDYVADLERAGIPKTAAQIRALRILIEPAS
jgi:predicted nucleic acid-binding protein